MRANRNAQMAFQWYVKYSYGAGKKIEKYGYCTKSKKVKYCREIMNLILYKNILYPSCP